ncbi:NACHT domain-containing protein [Mycena sanguinolenta]|uniref:NACHT domain-containing protein n=1 Tax=Mycena sanguinolenta TaxID=230812 RepID=A0A8H7DEQ2_9AGAR|nr:NACHT domain-containing protein [Mycena sanguinolenta]
MRSPWRQYTTRRKATRNPDVIQKRACKCWRICANGYWKKMRSTASSGCMAPRGAGKSAIMQTLAGQLQDAGRLGGSFFFKRNHATRRNAKTLFATVAYQLACNIEWLRTPISQIVEKDPSVVVQSIATQMKTLISDPCRGHRDRDCVPILIDGLDECDGQATQTEILRTICDSSSNHANPLRFVIASRPEPHIREMFDSPSYVGICRLFNVEQSFDDVRKYLHDEFSRIHREHSTMTTIPLPWPSPDVLERLVWKSSGHFIYAATIIRFIDDEYYRPTERLATVLGDSQGSEAAFDALDQLYMAILCSSPSQSELVPILCAIVNFDLNIWTIDLVLEYADKETRLLLRGLHSLLNIPPDDGEPISLHHASFSDFLDNPGRSLNFCVGTLDRRMDLARSLLTLCARQHQTEWLRLSGPRSLQHKLIPFITSLPPSAELCSLIGDMNPDYISDLESYQQRMVSWLRQVPSAPHDLLKVWEDLAHVPSTERHDGGSANDLPSLSSASVVSDDPKSSPDAMQHSGDAGSDRSPSFLEEESPQSTTFRPNMITQAEPVPSSSEPQISTFVVFMPDSALHANDPTAVCREDAKFLEEIVTDGGHFCSIHRSVEAENWVERNYDSTLLKSLRAIGLGGPIATMLSAGIPALAIFGSILESRVFDVAQTLSHESGLPVMIRPPTDNPVTIFSQLTGFDVMPTAEPENDSETDDESEFDGRSSESASSVNDSNDEDDPRTDVFRPRGGATREDTADEILPKGYQTTKLRVAPYKHQLAH